MKKENSIKLFEDKKIRSVWNEEDLTIVNTLY